MADTRVYSNGYLDIVFVPINGLTNPDGPTLAQVNAGVNVSEAVAWDGTTFPVMSESSDVEDRGIKDAGNAQSRGFAQYEGSLTFFYPRDLKDVTSSFGKAFQMLKLPGGSYWVVTRILQGVKGEVAPFAAGQYVSVYKFIADTFINELEGEDSYKYQVEMLQQGFAYPNTLLAPAGAITVTNASGAGSIAVGAHAVLRATVSGHRANQLVKWTSSDSTKATVSPNGVVTGVAAGTASITASHPSATSSSTPVTITVA